MPAQTQNWDTYSRRRPAAPTSTLNLVRKEPLSRGETLGTAERRTGKSGGISAGEFRVESGSPRRRAEPRLRRTGLEVFVRLPRAVGAKELLVGLVLDREAHTADGLTAVA